MNAYEKGWKAYEDGRSWITNPYESGTAEWDEWDDGWFSAEEEGATSYGGTCCD